jgi:uracil-DNA glycosylase family 4
MQHRRERCNCNICPLNGSRKVFSTVGEGARIAVLAEAPGEAEEESGIPLSGPSGRLFNLGLARAGLPRDKLWIANTILCRPPENAINSPEGASAVSCCRNGLSDELLAMRRNGVRVIAAMGAVAAEALGLEGSISKIRGSVYVHKRTEMLIVPMLHPAAILRHGGGKSKGISALAAFISDLTKVREISVDGWTPPKERFNIEPTAADVVEFVDDALAQKRLIALDIETTGLSARRGANVVVIGLASSESNALVVPMLAEHGIPYWQNGDSKKVTDALNVLFRNGRFILQNCFFDVPFLRYHGWDISVDAVEHDTMVLHSLVSPETEHNLGYIVSIYGKTPEWKEVFKNRTQSILEMDQLEMRRYNARDCVVLHQVLGPMLRDLHEDGLDDFYATETKPLMKPFMRMTEAGVAFDVAHMAAFKKRIGAIVTEKEAELKSQYALPPSFNLDNIDEVRWLMFGQPPTKASRLRSTLVTYTKELKSGTKSATKLLCGVRPTEVKPADLPPNVVSIEEVDTLAHKKEGSALVAELRDIESLMALEPLYTLSSYRGAQTDGSKEKISRDALLSYRIALLNRLDAIDKLKNPEAKTDEVDAIDNVLAFMEGYNEFKEKHKLERDFTKYGPDPDGRVRPSWMMSGTATGRLSCKQPNLAQLPTHGEGKDVRRFFIAPPGYDLIDADYSNLEVALLGYESGDPIIISIYEQKRNIHDENAQLLFHLNPVPEDDLGYSMWKQAREAAKVFQFGGLSYGGGDRQIHKMILTKAPKLRLTLHDYVVAKEEWMHAHPVYTEWRERITAEVTAKRKLKNALGRERIFLGHPRDIIKEGMNFMIQSLGACTTNRAMIRIEDRVREEKMRTGIIMQVYDEIVLESPEEETAYAAKMQIEEMTRPFKIYDRTVRLRAEGGIGKTYGDAK